jgi:hypothetical protein
MMRRDMRSRGMYEGGDRISAMIDAAAGTILNPLHSPIPTPAFRGTAN